MPERNTLVVRMTVLTGGVRMAVMRVIAVTMPRVTMSRVTMSGVFGDALA